MADDEDWSGLLITPELVRGTLLPVMEKRRIAVDRPDWREAIIDVAIRETVTTDQFVINSCKHKGWDRLRTGRLMKEQFVFDLMSVLNRFNDGRLPFQGKA